MSKDLMHSILRQLILALSMSIHGSLWKELFVYVRSKLIKKGWAFKTKVNKPGGGGDELYL